MIETRFTTDKKAMQSGQLFTGHPLQREMHHALPGRARNELETALNTYSDLFDFAPFGYFTLDMHGNILRTNIQGAHLLAVESELLVNVPFTGFIADAEGKKSFSQHLAMVLQRKVILKCEIRLRGNDGTEINGQLQSVALPLDNRAGYILTTVVDNSVRKELEVKLRQAHDNLELMVQERTKDLSCANKQLSQEIEEHKMAEESLKNANAEITTLKERLRAENRYLQEEASRQYNFGEIVGQSALLARVFTQVEQVAPMNATVLLLGETGTGKGVVARAIHSSSSRKGRPLITVNCTTLPATLVESELFGRERGAFTGSDGRQAGRFELADGGTIFLDEIGEMPLDLQCKLLRVIQDGEFERLGSSRTLKTDVRIIAATNRNLEEAIRKGTFREDLFYRLNVFPITMPPLRQRKDDIPLLVNHFVAKFNKKTGKKIESIPLEILNTLQAYHWPGNVRELESVIERAVIISKSSALQIMDRFDALNKPEESDGQTFKLLDELEHDHIMQVLLKTNWRIEGNNGAAMILGINSSTLRARIRKYGIVRQ